MKRSEFIKSIGLGSTGLVLPKNWFSHQPVKIYDNYVRGMQHYDFKKVEKLIQTGEPLQLKREPDNLYDMFAVEVYYRDKKLGYLAAFENISIAHMLDAGVKLYANVSYFRNESNPYKMQTLGVVIYAELVRATDELITEIKQKRADDIHDIYRKSNFYEL